VKRRHVAATTLIWLALCLAAGQVLPGKTSLPAGAERVLGSPHMRTSCMIADLAFAKDALVSVDCNAKVERWSLKTGELISSFAPTGHVSGVDHALSPDGALLAAVQRTKHMSGPEFVTVWDAVTGKKKKTFPHHPASPNDLTFSPDKKTLVTADSDDRLRIWNVATGKIVRKLDGRQPWGGGILGLSEAVPEIWEEIGSSFSADGTLVATAHAEGENRVHEAASGKILVTMDGTGWGPVPVILPGNETVAYASHGGIKLVSMKTGKEIGTIVDPKGVVMERDLALAASPDGKKLATGTTEGRVHIFDLEGTKAPRMIALHADRVEVVVFSPDGKLLASAGRDRTIGLWDATTGKRALPLVRHFGWITDLEVSPDGTLLASAGEGAGVHLWSLETGKLVRSLRSEQQFKRVWMHHALAFTSDGKLLYSGSTEGDLVAWHAGSGKEALRKDSPSIASDMALSPDGKTIALVDAWGSVVLVDSKTAAMKKKLSDQYSWGYHFVNWLADGTLVSTGMGNKLMIWKAGSHKVLVDETLGHNVYQLEIPPEPGTISIRSYDTLHTWKRGKKGWKPAGGTMKAPGDVAYSHDGKLLAKAMDEKTIVLRKRKGGKKVKTFKSKAGGIGQLTFTPDDASLISSHFDGTITVWKVP